MTTTLSLESLGFTKEDLQQRVIDRLCEQVMESTALDDGEEMSVPSAFSRRLETLVQQRIDATIAALAEAHVLPNVATYIETLTLQTTNKWGEKQGTPVTFIEYLVRQAETYMLEKVNYEGKPKGTDSYSWTGTQTRIAHLIDKHLHYSIEQAMQLALKTANSAIVAGIEETVKIKLGEFAAALKVSVETKKR